MAIDARRRFENASPFRQRLGPLLRRAAAARWTQRCELVAGIHIDAQQHLGVLRSAILRALAQEEAGLVRVDPHAVRVIRNQVGLARQARDPEAVVGIGGKQLSGMSAWDGRIADRHVQLVGRDDAESGIAILPPELVTDDGHFDGIGGLRGVLNGVDDAGRRQEQGNDDENRNDRPGQLHLGASVDLGGLVLSASSRFLNLTTAYASKLKTTMKIAPEAASTKRPSLRSYRRVWTPAQICLSGSTLAWTERTSLRPRQASQSR